jgi:GntR family transcriptional repressor for pyruvate dehydrogenase complex
MRGDPGPPRSHGETMPIHAVENPRLYRQIADQLASLIDSGEYAVGDRLPPERTLAEQLKVSRSSVREALIALEVEGCIEVRGGNGVFVVERKQPHKAAVASGSHPGPFEILQVRSMIEPEAAALAARHASKTQIALLESTIEEMARNGYAQLTGLQHDGAFHLCIAEASGNSALAMTMRLLWDLRVGPLYIQMEQHFHNAPIWQRAIDQHRVVLDAIKERDSVAARAAMRKHIKSAQSRFTSTWIDDPVALAKDAQRPPRR